MSGSGGSNQINNYFGGYVTDAIGHLPEAGEELSVGRFHFRVGRADQRRVHSFVVSIHGDE